MTPALLATLLVIVAGALVVLSRVGLLAVAVIFWFTFATALGILALSGHAFSANWHLGPVADYYFWKVLVLSPEVFIFLAFMITDPRTAPGERARAADLLGRDRPPRSPADRADDERVLGEGGAARLADDRVRRPAADHSRARGARAARAPSFGLAGGPAPGSSRCSAPRRSPRSSSRPAFRPARSPASPAARSRRASR